MPFRGQLVYRLNRWLWTGLDWLYPPCCGGCQNRGARWCLECQSKTELISQLTVCPRCGVPQNEADFCNNCQSSSPHFMALRAWAIYKGPVRQAVHRLKYKGDLGLGEVFGHLLMDYLRNLHWHIDTVIPVPLGVERLAQRGYNQASLLARPVAWGLGLDYLPEALKRVRETRSQVDLSAVERKRNVLGAFRASRDQVAGRRVLVVDDVATSGATIDSCAAALRGEGAIEVYGLTLARAVIGQNFVDKGGNHDA
jgi:competence protein ComFC